MGGRGGGGGGGGRIFVQEEQFSTKTCACALGNPTIGGAKTLICPFCSFRTRRQREDYRRQVLRAAAARSWGRTSPTTNIACTRLSARAWRSTTLTPSRPTRIQADTARLLAKSSQDRGLNAKRQAKPKPNVA